MTTEAFSEMGLPALGASAYASIQRGDVSKQRAEDLYKSAGLYLAEAKRRVAKRKDMTWPQYLLAHCNVGQSRANEIIMIADGRTTLEDVREGFRVRQAACKARTVHRDHGETSPNPKRKQQSDPVSEARDTVNHARTARLACIKSQLNALTDDQLSHIEQVIASWQTH